MKRHENIPQSAEGRRARKRRETRARIADTALALFKKKGFSAVTVDEITEAADVSKRTFFDYFPAKEDVVIAWQDRFMDPLSEAIAAAPKGDTPVAAVERSMIDVLAQTATEESFALTELIRATPALRARDQRKYVFLEERLAKALRARYPRENSLGLKLLAMIVVGALRIGADEWRASEGLKPDDIRPFTRKVFRTLWKQLASFSKQFV